MARKPRVEFEGAFYHVMVRGNQRRRIFRDDQRTAFGISIESSTTVSGTDLKFMLTS